MHLTLKQFLAAIVLGGCGFALNSLELQLGWGMHFIFGNALVYAFLRLMPPASFVAAASISSAWTIVLWNHPWAWLIWTLEAGLVARLASRASPVRSDVCFWLVVGTPLLIGSYGWVMQMDELSLGLVIAKQAINAVLNVALGELLYTLGLQLLVNRTKSPVNRLPIEAFVLMIMATTVLVPAILFLSFDANAREQNARSTVAADLERELNLDATALALWQTSRSSMLLSLAAADTPSGTQPLPPELKREFSAIAWLSDAALSARLVRNAAQTNSSAPWSALTVENYSATNPVFSLIATSGAAETKRAVMATLHPQTLPRLIAALGQQSNDVLVLRHNNKTVAALNRANANGLGANLPPDIMAASQSAAVLLSSTSYGSALMSDLKNAAMLRTVAITSMPGWEITGIAPISKVVLAERRNQLDLFLTLAGIVVLVTVIGSLFARRIERSLRNLAQNAADLAVSGTNRTVIDRLVIRELSDISINLATVGSAVARERGALISYQRRLRSIAKHAPVVVYALDTPRRRKAPLQYISDAIENLLGYSIEEASHPSWWANAVHPEDYPGCIAAFNALQPGQAISHEYRIRHKAGHYVWVYDTLALEKDQISNREEAVGLILDVSDRRRATEQLIQADKMASLGRMVAGIAHELNQPLNFIKLAVNNLQTRTLRGQLELEPVKHKLASILTHVNRASAIIMQMRVFGRTPTETMKPILVAEAIADLKTLLVAQFEADGIQLDTARCEPGLRVTALPVLLEQVLLNILLNARDAIQSQPRQMRGGLIRLAAWQHDSRAIITIEDNGPGISDQLMPRLFEPFFTTKPPRQGTGLGLSICYGIIQDLGGTIEAANSKSGAIFTINLPAACPSLVDSIELPGKTELELGPRPGHLDELDLTAMHGHDLGRNK